MAELLLVATLWVVVGCVTHTAHAPSAITFAVTYFSDSTVYTHYRMIVIPQVIDMRHVSTNVPDTTVV